MITPKLRLPAESLVNKRRNVTIALGAVAAAGVRLDGAAGQARVRVRVEVRLTEVRLTLG